MLDVTCVMICSPSFCDGLHFARAAIACAHFPKEGSLFVFFFFPAGSFITDYLCPFVHPLFMASGT